MSDYLTEKLEPIIAEHGWAVIMVGDDEASFAYTIGLCGKGLPELILLLPIDPSVSHQILNNVATRFSREQCAVAGDLDEIITSLPVRLRDVSVAAFTEHGLQAVEWAARHGHPIERAMQVVLPDTGGRFPTDAGYDWATQPYLGAPESPDLGR